MGGKERNRERRKRKRQRGGPRCPSEHPYRFLEEQTGGQQDKRGEERGKDKSGGEGEEERREGEGRRRGGPRSPATVLQQVSTGSV